MIASNDSKCFFKSVLSNQKTGLFNWTIDSNSEFKSLKNELSYKKFILLDDELLSTSIKKDK